MELAIIVFTSLEGPAPSVSGKDAITKRTPGALSPGKSTVIESSVGLVAYKRASIEESSRGTFFLIPAAMPTCRY